MISETSLFTLLQSLLEPRFEIYEAAVTVRTVGVKIDEVVFASLEGYKLSQVRKDLESQHLIISNQIKNLAKQILAGFVVVKQNQKEWISHEKIKANLACYNSTVFLDYPDPGAAYSMPINDHLHELKNFCQYLIEVPSEFMPYKSELAGKKTRDISDAIKSLNIFIDGASEKLFENFLLNKYNSIDRINWTHDDASLGYLIRALYPAILKALPKHHQQQWNFVASYFTINGEFIIPKDIKRTTFKSHISDGVKNRIDAAVNNLLNS